jgi:hypothetical protein
MERTLLYYPTIDIPNSDWLASALLYTDKVSSILPGDRHDDPKYSDAIKFLVDNGQYKPVFIKEILNKREGEIWNLEHVFLENVYTILRKKDIGKKSVKMSSGGLSHVYSSKMTFVIEQHLISNKIGSKKGETIEMDEELAFFYMGLLAQYVAKISMDDLVIPSTDQESHENIAFGLAKDKVEAFHFILKNCLPVPAPDTTLEEIVALKMKRRSELIGFRQFLKKVQDEIGKASTPEEIREIQIDTKESIEKGLADLNKVIKDGKIKTIFSTFSSLIKFEKPKIFSSLPAIGLTTALNPYVGVATGLVSVGGEMVSSYLSKQEKVDNSEFAYLFRARQEGIIN